MTISVIQAILIGLLYYLGINGTPWTTLLGSCLLYTSDAADEEDSVDLGGTLII